MINAYLPYLPRKLFIFGTFVFFLFVFSTIQIKQHANEVSARHCASSVEWWQKRISSAKRISSMDMERIRINSKYLSIEGRHSSIALSALEPLELALEPIEKKKLSLKDHVKNKADTVIEGVSSGYYKTFNINFRQPCERRKSFSKSSEGWN